ncbi:serine/threonine-protein kinase 31 isoform X2 [Gopherus flavomarginatus]|uniref:serine/threonine-protein kinase 31 isoform X2 n=1 Tax=Gopherus flavomarginatus TaxID=286002 RepID=UPI0021CC1F99|nr:serine/threonine-protein kinase 31 isoform X2 [Gopherus flavomarginatus]
MDENTGYNEVEDVVGCHVEDAVTFWAQNMSRNNDILKLSHALAEVCPQANSVFGNPDFTKIYGGCFSEDKCWYRCKVQQVISDEKCQVLYIDYGNSEMLNRSEIVEIPKNLQFPSIAKKYRLWGLQIPPDQDLNQFDQGRKFLCSLIFEKEIKMRHKATYQDGTIVAQAEYGKVDIGEEVAKKGFAEKCKSPINANNCDEKKIDVAQYQPWNAKISAPAWENRPKPSVSNRLKGRFGDQIGTNMRNENHTGNHMPFVKEKLMAHDFNIGSNISLAKIKQDQKLIEENEKLRNEREILQKENQILLHNYKELESTIAHLNHQVQEEKETSEETLKHLGKTLQTYVGTKMRSLAAQIEVLKNVRCSHMNVHFGDDLFRAVKEVTERCLIAPSSLEKLEKIWAEYNLAQEMIQLCRNVNESDILILKRNEVRQNLYSAVEEFILEADELPLSERSTVLQELSGSLEAIYGQVSEANDSEEAFQQFFEWKQTKLEEFNRVRSVTNASLQILATWFSGMKKLFDLTSEVSLKSEEVVGNVDEVLEKAESDICKELEISLVEQDEADKEIILNAYSKVIRKIRQEQHLITVVQSKYLASVESDDYSEYEITKIKEEITGLRNNLIQEIYNEQEEYETLTYLVQKWFPELPLLHPEAGILKYMNSGGLLAVSLERDLLDAEPLKELSTKHPLVCSAVQEQKVLLKGYAVDVSTEAKVIERTARYHRAWSEFKEKSGLLQLMFLFLCKSDPLVYLMVPYYPGASLGALQASTPLTSEEILKVMEGVARGLHTLHKANIVHGSLHTNNVFAVNRKQGIVGDFDFTKSVDQRASANSMVVGNLNLISPELRMGHLASPSSDMYAYGCLLFWLFAGDQEFKIKENGTPEVDELNMDDKVKSLLLNLICSNRMTAEQVLNDDCFLLPDVIQAPPQNEPGEELECEKAEETGEVIISSDKKIDDDEEMDASQ